MKMRFLSVLAVLLILTACAPASEPAPEPAPEPEPEAGPAGMDDAAAIDAIRAAYLEHYNAGDAAGVVGLFTDAGWYLPADGGTNQGSAALQTALEASLATGSPAATIATSDTMVMGDYALSRGPYSVEMTPEGAEAMSFGGNYMTFWQRVEGDWKIAVLLTNYDAAPAEDMPAAPAPAERQEEMFGSPISALLVSYSDHYNQGHGDVVAEMYSEGTIAAFADNPVAEGRDAVAAYFAESMAVGSPQLAIYQVGHQELGDGWHLGGGWFELTTDDGGGREGYWMTVVSTAADGTQLIEWSITNMRH